MARAFSNAKNVYARIANQIFAVVSRRGYDAVVSQGNITSNVRIGATQNVMLKKGSEETSKTTWAPDPVTGYYRPENITNEIDVAELRAILLKNKTREQ